MHESLASIAGLYRLGDAPDDTGASDHGRWCVAGLARGMIHDIHADTHDDAAAGAGFAIALSLAAQAAPLLWLRTEAAERRGGRLHAQGLADLGIDPESLLLAVVADEAALLRAGADAARCRGLGTLLIETWGSMPGFGLTATRRLMLAAETSGVTVLALRVGARPGSSAAATRWSVAALPSAALALDVPGVPAPGFPAFAIECQRRRGGPAGQRWCVEWNRESRSFVPRSSDPLASSGDASPLSGADIPLAARRTAALDPPAPVRRAG